MQRCLQGLCRGERSFGLRHDLYSRVVDLYIICGTKLNAPSQKAAEEMALRGCQAGLSKWKVKTASGGCAISASK